MSNDPWGEWGQEGITHAFVQWKGNNSCFDFICECGEQCHWDGFFAYVVKCPDCEALWEMPHLLYPRRTENVEQMPVVEPAKYVEDDWYK